MHTYKIKDDINNVNVFLKNFKKLGKIDKKEGRKTA